MEFAHVPIMLTEVLEGLSIRENGTYVDGTLGGAGHSSQIASRLTSTGCLIGIDQDEEAIEASTKRLAAYDCQIKIVRDNYSHFETILNHLGIDQVDGILLDLGVSSHQLDDADRGFSFRFDAPLDMRMDQRAELTAYDIVNKYPLGELDRIIREYGEDKFHRNIASRIVKARERNAIQTTGELADIIASAVPAKVRRTGGHPAKKTFQAIRIEVNGELQVLSDTLDTMIDHLSDGGRICVITFHSLEDRIVKQKFKTAQDPCICPPDFPVCTCGRKSKGKVITRKPLLPAETEYQNNPRSTSAKLRIFERSRKEEVS